MAKLHELLAVESDLEGKTKRLMNEGKKVFSDKPALFMGAVRVYKPFIEDGVDYPEEHQALTTTVNEKLEYINKEVIRYWDALLQKEVTNQNAIASIIIDGKIIGEDLPATFLLGLEKRLRRLREVYESIPTLAVGTEWKKDEAKGEGIWVIAHPEETLKTVRTVKSKVLYEATDHHPAQIDKWEENESVGKYTKTIWSGMISPAKKSKYLERIDKLIQAVKKARQRANSTDVVNKQVAKNLIDYING
jgi:hypothetical protein